MSDIIQQATNAIINAADSAFNSAIAIVGNSADLAVATVTAPINIGGKALDALLDEAASLHEKAFALLREIADTVTEPLP